MMFPYARAVVTAQKLDARLIEPHWWRPRLGPYLRRERDKRRYDLLTAGPPLGQLAQDRLTIATSRLLDEELRELRSARWRGCRSTIIVKGMGRLFGPIWDDRAVVLREFERVFAPALSVGIPTPGTYYAVHVRLGDFVRRETSAATPNGRNMTTPLSWFMAAIRNLQERSPGLPVVICSDGTDDELQSILRIRGVERARSANAIADLWTLAGAKTLVGSGSTFTAWASFLSKTPTLLQPGTNHYLPGAPWVCEAETPALRTGASQEIPSEKHPVEARN